MPIKKSLDARFWEKVRKDAEHWIWVGATSNGRYGFIGVDGKNHQVNRVAYELTYGPIPDGVAVVRQCGAVLCVRPDHLSAKVHGQAGASLEDRFWARVKRAAGCWFWQGSRNATDYGLIYPGRKSKRSLLAHRVSWEIHNGPIPNGLHVLHHCDTPPCVNPEHVFLGTQTDNNADRDAKGRGNIGAKNGAAVLKAGQVREILRRYDNRDPRPSTRKWRNPDGVTAIAEDYGVDTVTVFDIVHRKTWTHLE